MKTFRKFKYAVGVMAVIAIVSCTEDITTNIDLNTEEIETSDYDIIQSMGWQTEGIVELDDSYIVEGDVVINKADIDSVRLRPSTRQVKYTQGIITGGREETIRVKISSNNLPDPEWREAARQAVYIWNTVPNCRVRFYCIEQQILYHDVKVEMSTDTEVAAANPPANGKPGKYVIINPNIDWYNRSLEQKVYILVHEFGHILGLGHTDLANTSYDLTHIAGTPDWNAAQRDNNSVMIHNSAGRNAGQISSWSGFTAGDILAIQSMYGTPDYSVAIVGPDALLPGETATFELLCPALLQGYSEDFNTVWTINNPEMEIISETSADITIRNNDNTLRATDLFVNVNYNGKSMSDRYIFNGYGNSGYYGFNDRTVTVPTLVSGVGGIWTNNVTVKSGASLTFQAPTIVINEPFTAEAGAMLVLAN